MGTKVTLLGEEMKRTFRVVSRASDGSYLMSDFLSDKALTREFEQIGMDDCHTDLTIRGLPVLKGLVGPMADGKHVRYETPAVFEELTKEWAIAPSRQTEPTETVETAQTH